MPAARRAPPPRTRLPRNSVAVPLWMTLLPAALAACAAAFAVLTWYGRRSANWGATDEEVAAEMSGDEWLPGEPVGVEDRPAARVRMTRGAWVNAPAEDLWPWVAQMGRGAGWYSYDRIDNGGRPSARHIVSWIPEPRLGDAIPIGYLRRLEPGREMVWWLPAVRFLGSEFRGVTLYRVSGAGVRSRLVMRIQADARGPLARAGCWLFRAVDGFMARRQLAGMVARAERFGARRRDPDHRETGARDQYQLYQAIYASGEEAGVPGKEGAAGCRRAAIADGIIEPPRA